MKRKNSLAIYIMLICCLFTHLIQGQGWQNYNSGPNSFNQPDYASGTYQPIESVGIGEFQLYGLHPQSALHVSTLYMPLTSHFLPGEVFRTDCPLNLATSTLYSTYWRMLNDGLERGRIFHLGPDDENDFFTGFPAQPNLGAHFYIQSSYDGKEYFYGDVRFNTPGPLDPTGASGTLYDATPRMRIVGGEGYVGIGDYRTFYPKNLLHLHIPSYNNGPHQNVYEQFTNDNTTATDDVQGFKIGITYDGSTYSDAELLSQQQGAHMNFYTNGSGVVTNRVRITAGGNVGVNTITPNSKVEINSGTANVSGLQFTNLTSSSAATIAPYGKVLTVASDGKVALTDILSACSGVLSNNYINKTTAANTICSSDIFENNALDVGIGTTTPAAKLNVKVSTAGTSSSAIIGEFDYTNTNASGSLYHAIGVYSNTNIASGSYNDGFLSATNGGNTCRGFTAIVNNTNTPTSENIGVYAVFQCVNGSTGPSLNYGLKSQMTVMGDNTYNVGVFTAVGNTSYHPGYNYGGYFKSGDSEHNYGIYAESLSNTTNSSTAKYYGVLGIAGASTTSANATREAYGGWFSAVDGTSINYGVYATNNNTGTCTSGACVQAAGFFNGPICATANSYVPSDAALKTNVNDLTNADFILSQLHPKTYYYDTVQYHMNLSSGLQFGLIAQELALVLPQFTRQFAQPEEKDTLGNIIHPQESFTGISYEPLITLLIAGYQQQKQQIDSLITALNNPLLPKNQNNNTPQKTGAIDVKLTNIENSILYQNLPNPYTSSTTIRYFIPENVSDVKITFQDATGKTLKEVKVNETGQGSIELDGSNLINGIYTYSLVIGNKVVDTKKMVKQ